MHISKLTQNIELQKLMLDFAKARRAEISQDEVNSIIKKKPYYPMLKDNLYNPLKSMLKSLAFNLTVGGQMKNTMRDLLFNNELETKMDLYIQFVAEYLIDDVFGREVGATERQNLEELLKPISKVNFRELYHRIIYLRSPEILQSFKELHFESTDESDGVLVYGYIDRMSGLSFKGLCCANIDNNGQMKICSINPTADITIRAASIENSLYLDMLETNTDLFEFTDIISRTMEIYDTNNMQIELMRELRVLDPFRHPHYPDDLYVNLISYTGEIEKVWVKYHSYVREKEDTFIVGELLNEPNNDFGCHLGDLIDIRHYGDEENNFLAYLK